MATGHFDYSHGTTHPGRADIINPADVMFPPGGAGGHNPFGFFGSNILSNLFGKLTFPVIGGGYGYAAGNHTVTNTGTGGAAAQATNGGVLLTAGSSSTFNTNLQSLALWTPTVNKRIVAAAMVQSSDITTVGWEFNIGSSAVDPGTTNYTDVIGFKMAVGAGTILGKVRGDAGTQAVTGTLYTAVAATDLFMAISAGFRATDTTKNTTVTTGASSTTQTLGSTANIVAGQVLYFATTAVYRTVISVTNATQLVVDATLSTTTAEVVSIYQPYGSFFIGADHLTTTETAFSAAQLVQLGKILTTPVSMYCNLHAKGSAGNPTVTFGAVMAQVDR